MHKSRHFSLASRGIPETLLKGEEGVFSEGRPHMSFRANGQEDPDPTAEAESEFSDCGRH